MRLVEFSVTNYRSITSAHKIALKNLTVLVGKNNEGKSNLLRALNVAMNAVISHSRNGGRPLNYHYKQVEYDWHRDFPIQYQERTSGLESIFRLNFRLEDGELNEFHSVTKIRGNEDIPIEVRIGRDNVPKVKVPKRGSSSYNQRSSQITEFISRRIHFNYIQAIRTDQMALDALNTVIWHELESLEQRSEYVEARQKIYDLQQESLDHIAETLTDPLRTFLPSLSKVSLKQDEDHYAPIRYGRDFDVLIDDGIETSISNKGDGIKSLVTLAILQNTRNYGGASVIAIEEPESHLHSGAIHSLVNVIQNMAKNNQVIITTHNPLFVQQNKISANIIVDNGTARVAKNVAEIRDILGVLPSDNLRNARFVLVVEGEDDMISLEKLLPYYSDKIKAALQSNQLVIKSLGGASNLAHDLADLKHSLCTFFVLLDNDEEGRNAADKAKANGLLDDSELRFTICRGSSEAEFEDALNPNIYVDAIERAFNASSIRDNPQFRGSKKWSDRVKDVFLSQGLTWNASIEKKVKLTVANAIPEKIENIDETVISQKAGFIQGTADAVERMLSSEG